MGDHCSGMRNVEFRFPSMAQTRLLLKVSIHLFVNLCIVLIIGKVLYEIVKICLRLLLSESVFCTS